MSKSTKHMIWLGVAVAVGIIIWVQLHKTKAVPKTGIVGNQLLDENGNPTFYGPWGTDPLTGAYVIPQALTGTTAFPAQGPN